MAEKEKSEMQVVFDERKGPRPFGTGQLLMLIGVGLSLIFTIVTLVLQLDRFGFGWVAVSQIVFVLIQGGAIAGVILGLKDGRWLLVGYGLAGLILIMLIGQVSTVAVGRGMDFFVMLGAVLLAAGTYMADQGIGVWPAEAVSVGGGPEAQLARLKEMLKDELITEEEYNQKRQDLLDKM